MYKFTLILTLLLFSCINKPNPFILSTVEQIRIFERSDHAQCYRLHGSLEDPVLTLNSSLYWRCRLSLTKAKLTSINATPEDLEYNLKVGDLIKKITQRLETTTEEEMERNIKKVDDRQHKRCIKMGFEFETTDQIKIDEYYSCRKTLIEENQGIPPFNNDEYMPYLNHTYNMSFVINRKLDNENKIRQKYAVKYPQCVGFNIYSKDFRSCIKAYDESRQCYKTLKSKRSNRELEERLDCQRRAYIEFPDSLMNEKDLHAWEIEASNSKADYYNRFSLSSVGIANESQFSSNEKTEEEIIKPDEPNTKEGLYNKLELSILRRKYIYSCNKDADEKIYDYIKSLNMDCEKIKEFKLEGEE